MTAALIAMPCIAHSVVRGQGALNPRFDALVSLAEARMKEHGVPGVALGIVADGVTTIHGLGVTNVEDPLPITGHTVFPIASISKTFAATAMMRLVEQGKVDLRAPVRTYLPDFRVRDEAVSRDVTVWHLLTHLGGWEGQVSGPDRGSETLKNFVGTITDLMQVAPPGKAWSYNNAGFSIAGRVIEVVTGTSINQAIRDLVFRPLGLEHAGTTAGEFIVQRFAAGHTTRDGKTALQKPFSPSTSVTAGGVGLCITDLLAYARFHMGDGIAVNGERVLKRESLEQMRTVQAHKQGTDDDIGLAWHIRQVGAIRTFGHGGTLGGHILLLEIVPERNFAMAILTNSNAGWRLIQDVEREALKSYLGAAYAPNQAIAHRGLVETLPSAQPLAQQPDPAPYLGTYTRPSNSYVVRADGGKLFVQDRPIGGGAARESPVVFYGPDRLVVTDGPDRGQSIEFVRDDGGRVNWIRVVGRVAVRSSSPQSGPDRAEVLREQRTVVVDRARERWRLAWKGQPKPACAPDDGSGDGWTTCPCVGFAFGEQGDLDLVRVAGTSPEDRLSLTALFDPDLAPADRTAILQRWQVLDKDQAAPGKDASDAQAARIHRRPNVSIMNLRDYDHDGRATEFFVQIAADPCGKRLGIVVGISRDRPTLHVFGSAAHPDKPLVLRADHWDALAQSRAPAARVDWRCGDHGTTQQEELALRIEPEGIHVTRLFYQCTADDTRGALIRTEDQ